MTINSNMLFASKNYIDEATITGPATQLGFGLENLQDIELWTFARFSLLDTANTYYVMEWPESKPFQLIGLLKHNLSPVGQWRVRIANSVADLTSSPTYDSGWVKTTPGFTGYGSLPWGEWNWGDIMPAEVYSALNQNSWLPMPEEVIGRAMRIDIDDEAENAFGFVQSSRLWCGEIYQPTYNPPYGARLLTVDKTKVQEMESGVRMYGTVYKRRAMELSLDLPLVEMLYKVSGPIFTLVGINKELVVILHPLRPETWAYEAIYGNIEKPGDVEHSSWDRTITNVLIDERV